MRPVDFCAGILHMPSLAELRRWTETTIQDALGRGESPIFARAQALRVRHWPTMFRRRQASYSAPSHRSIVRTPTGLRDINLRLVHFVNGGTRRGRESTRCSGADVGTGRDGV